MFKVGLKVVSWKLTGMQGDVEQIANLSLPSLISSCIDKAHARAVSLGLA